MSQYIRVFLDDEKRYYKNRGLYGIIEYIGRQEHKGKLPISSNEAYKLGKKSINSRLNKWHKTAIENLVSAEKYEFKYNYDQKSSKPIWKIHKNKAKKIFRVIYSYLNRYNNPEICLLFQAICAKFNFASGAEAAGDPYYKKVANKHRLIADNFSEQDIKSLTRCACEIQKFSEFYR